MRRTPVVVLALVAACALSGCVPHGSARQTAQPALPRSTPTTSHPGPLDAVETWAFAIGVELDEDTLARLAAFDLVVVDAEDTPADEIALLQRHDTIVLGYLSVGTIEDWRSYYDDIAGYRLEPWDEWGEWYANVSDRGYRDIIVDRIVPGLLGKGFDGLFLDNVDMIETHPKHADGMQQLVAEIAELVHDGGGYLFTQNGEAAIEPMVVHLDGWNREDVTFTYDFDTASYVRVSAEEHAAALDALRAMRARGLLILATDYVEPTDDSDAAEAAAEARSVGALPYAGDIELSRVPETP